MTTATPTPNQNQNPLEKAVANKTLNDAWVRYTDLVMSDDFKKAEHENVTRLDVTEIRHAAQAEREKRMIALANASAAAPYPLAHNHALIDTMLDEWKENH